MSNSKNIQLTIEDGIARLIFDRPNSSANIFDDETLSELDTHLTQITKDASLKGLIIESAKDSIFIAGADIKKLSTASESDLEAFLKKAQSVFDRISDLEIPTVAAIHGAALGGGLEIALACKWRVASDHRSTKLGLPETQLGILPAWGGSTRLPKLIGLPKALDMILKGSTANVGKAKYSGLIDGIAPPDRLRVFARSLIAKSEPERKNHWLTNNPFAAWLIRKKVTKTIEAKTRGHYPAQLAAINVVCDSIKADRVQSLENERTAALELSRNEVTRNLMRIFFQTENSKRLKVGDASPQPIKRVCVVGAGVMGSGIAHWLSTRGIQVLLQDISPAAIARGMQTTEKLRSEMVTRRLITKTEAATYRDRIQTTATPVSLKSMDMVIEAAVENLEIKKKIFTDLADRTRPDTILATNTSALPISDLAAHEGISHPERVVGLHFFNPVHRMKLVEVVAAKQTSDAVSNTCLKLVQKIGKLPVYVKDSPGFVVNRILMPYMIEAGELFERGAGAEAIDNAMLDFGMPMGPIRLLDEVGLDVSRHVAATMAESFPDKFTVPKILDQMIEAKQLGRKSKAGFYIYNSKEAPVNPIALQSRSGSGLETLDQAQITDRLVLLMVNESFRCLEEGVSEDPDAIDFAMIMGAGFAPFRGGPVNYAKKRGLKEIVGILTKLDTDSEGSLFAPAELLKKAANGEFKLS
ncbi:MAG: 3-hydroxyacyl-CoA dehydrogenase/enoyl-CoA hydratase/3-hydroxybutyryl-CoA epimerase [Verrucomicrobiales bacterium]|jgi:3-hydroxyacyl-CoA dehydrogenase/enoyl-CoA hydratase/3-hydroxybutyryl-CoA epimerase